MKSYGFEIELSWRDRIGEVDYGVKFNLADAQQKVVKYPNTTNAFNDWYAGKMSGEIWGYTSLGIAKTDEEMKEHLASLPCLLYTSDAADEEDSVDHGGRRIIKKNKKMRRLK